MRIIPLSKWAAAILFAGLLLPGCPKDPPATSNQTCPITCPLEWCNLNTGLCEPPEDDVVDADEPDVVEEVAEPDPDTTQLGDGTVQNDIEEEPDVEDEPDIEDEPELEVVEDIGENETDGGEDDTGEQQDILEEPEVEDEPDIDDEPDIPETACPDHLEPSGDDNVIQIHESLIIGDVESCVETYDPLNTNGCTCDGADCCQCGGAQSLALCGFDDVDTYRFDFLRGDVVSIRVIPDIRTDCFSYFAVVDRLKDEIGTIDTDFQRRAGCDGSRALGVNLVELNPAEPSTGDPGTIARYRLRVRSAQDDPIPYHIHVQVEPVSRGCEGDPWDDDISVHTVGRGSEKRCSTDDCTADLTTIGDPVGVAGNLCPWDRVDYVRHEITTEFPNTRRVKILFDGTVSHLTGNLCRLDALGDPTDCWEICPSCDDTTVSPSGIERVFDGAEGLWPAVYQLEVSSDTARANPFTVLFLDE